LKVIQEAEIKCQKTAEWDEWPGMRPTIPLEGIPHDEEPAARIKKVKS
jgi:hypothetical protein